MNRIEDKLLFYHTLSPDERAEIDAYVEGNPELQSMLEELGRLGVLFDSVRAMMKEPIHDDALVYYVVTRCYSRQDVPEALREVFERVDGRIASDASVRARYEGFVQRLQRLEEKSDAKEQFERLAGFSVGPNRTSTEDDHPPVVREPAPSRRIPRIRSLPVTLRWAAAAAIVLAVFYGALSALSVTVTPQHERLAALNSDELHVEGFDVRGRGEAFDGEEGSIDVLYLETLSLLREARTTTLGLFPRYDEQVLHTGEAQLEEVVAQAEPGSFLQLDALYFLGKVRLAQGNRVAAQEALQEVVRGEGRLSDEAYEILVQLAADDAY